MSTTLLEAKGLGVSFGGLRAVNDVSFAVARGEVFTLIGPNGAGKTTVFNLISRIYNPSMGTIEFKGENISAIAPHDIARKGIARTFQNIELFEHATVLQNLFIGRHRHSATRFWQDALFTGKARAQEREVRRAAEVVIEFLGMQHYRDAMVAGLPYGIRKVVELARGLVSQPDLLLLDEPSSGLNVEETAQMGAWIRSIQRQLGVTVLMVEHDMSLVSSVSDRVLAMNQGEILCLGTPSQVQSDARVIEAYLGASGDLSGFRRHPPLRYGEGGVR
ncbi:Lipopolysaccharide export system ATP-binding protein LptB (plasmid) [Variovorax sp. SRS16]|uniref:ABC transporter ATP-binding protein n=1 Tax=Variovorax sp. SRS16 TaxID=282217 RepID=UPI001316D04E|nr:ABC transporter ATP-binding protein [Variovorax sp. SRS16]VTU45531.1 Lipopolysaccharide export system ATP-binding protein LptB [Variovorax sp. SRS16]